MTLRSGISVTHPDPNRLTYTEAVEENHFLYYHLPPCSSLNKGLVCSLTTTGFRSALRLRSRPAPPTHEHLGGYWIHLRAGAPPSQFWEGP